MYRLVSALSRHMAIRFCGFILGVILVPQCRCFSRCSSWPQQLLLRKVKRCIIGLQERGWSAGPTEQVTDSVAAQQASQQATQQAAASTANQVSMKSCNTLPSIPHK